MNTNLMEAISSAVDLVTGDHRGLFILGGMTIIYWISSWAIWRFGATRPSENSSLKMSTWDFFFAPGFIFWDLVVWSPFLLILIFFGTVVPESEKLGLPVWIGWLILVGGYVSMLIAWMRQEPTEVYRKKVKTSSDLVKPTRSKTFFSFIFFLVVSAALLNSGFDLDFVGFVSLAVIILILVHIVLAPWKNFKIRK